MKTVIINYGSGNLRSVEKGVMFASQSLDMEVKVTACSDEVRSADRIILPGVGSFADCMKGLTAVSGMRAALEEVVIERGRPFLGICVGMQLLADLGLEHVSTKGFGWISGTVDKILAGQLKVPHMGWNNLEIDQPHALLNEVSSGDHAYFVHSYHFKVDNPKNIMAHVKYGEYIAAAVVRDNISGTQFHPEKSQAVGLKTIENFLKWFP